jgi:hypothetical protein
MPGNDVIPIKTDPDESDLGTAVSIECDQMRGCSRFDEFTDLYWNFHASRLLVKIRKICYDTNLYRLPQ